MVSHDVPQVFEISDRVAYMHGGKMVLAGKVADVLKAGNLDFDRFLAGKTSGEEERPPAQVLATPGR
jgi:phospholipid/cholesterol/gamma-HCH transport system ATP-binding protein